MKPKEVDYSGSYEEVDQTNHNETNGDVIILAPQRPDNYEEILEMQQAAFDKYQEEINEIEMKYEGLTPF